MYHHARKQKDKKEKQERCTSDVELDFAVER